MRITTNTNDTTATNTNDTAKVPFNRKQAVSLRRTAENLNVERYTFPDGKRRGALKLKGKLMKWAEVDTDRALAHNQAVEDLVQAVDALQRVAAHLDGLPENYNPGAPKKARGGSKFEVGAPVGVKEAKLEEYEGLIEDPRCLRVIEVRKSVIMVETTDGLRIPLAKSALEVIAD